MAHPSPVRSTQESWLSAEFFSKFQMHSKIVELAKLGDNAELVRVEGQKVRVLELCEHLHCSHQILCFF